MNKTKGKKIQMRLMSVSELNKEKLPTNFKAPKVTKKLLKELEELEKKK